jgi:hypothetical protein
LEQLKSNMVRGVEHVLGAPDLIPGPHGFGRPGPGGYACPFRKRLERFHVGSVIKKRRKRMAKKKHRKLLKKTRVQRRRLGK